MTKRSLTSRSPVLQSSLGRRRPWLGAVSLLLCLSVGTHTKALAEERTGLMLGLAIGPGNHFVEVSGPGSSAIVFDPVTGNTYYLARSGGTSRSNGGSVSVQMQLGYSFSSRFQAYAVQVMELKTVRDYYTGSTTLHAVETIRALAADYHLGHKAGPWFLGGGAGLSKLEHTEGTALAWMAEGGRDIGGLAQLRLTLTHSHHEHDGYSQDGYTVAALFGLHWE